MVNKKIDLEESFPLVSVVIPAYNRVHILGRAIQSVLDQTYSNFELIIVDDCSKDKTEEIVRDFKDNRIRYIRHDKNKGAVAARNTGIDAAKGLYVAFQDSDDEWLPEKLEKQMKAFKIGPPDLGVVYTSFWLIENGMKSIRPPPFVKQTSGRLHDSLLKHNFIGTPSAVVKRECFEKAGMFENIPRLQEWSLWLRISKYYSFTHINEPLVNAYLQPDGISQNLNAFIIARKFILTKYFSEISQKPKVLKNHYFEIGTLLCSAGDVSAGRSYFFKAIRLDPFDSKLLISTITAILGKRLYDWASEIYTSTKAKES